MNKKPTIKQAYSDKYQGTFIWGFLKIAENSLLSLENRKNVGKELWFPKNTKRATYNLRDKGLWVAIIWNIKHACELTLKTIGIQIDKKYAQIHDLNYLLKDLETKLQNKVRAITLNKFKRIIKKYYLTKIFPGKELVKVADMKNDIFKYTNNDAKINIDFKILDQISRKDITTIKKDIQFLENLFLSTENEIKFVTQMKRREIPKSKINTALREKRHINKK